MKNCNVKLDHEIVFFWSRCGLSFYYCGISKYEYNDDVTKFNVRIFRLGLERDCGTGKFPLHIRGLEL